MRQSLIVFNFWKKTKNKIQFNTNSLFYRGHTLPDVIALEYPNVENPVD
jgi:hypothetical protein